MGIKQVRLRRIPRASSDFAHRVMVANRGRNTGLELHLRNQLRSMGVRGYRTNYKVGLTRVDIAFPAKRLAILVHGCFWHHCPKCNLPLPRVHRAYWERKFKINMARDWRVKKDLKAIGWSVIEIWEHEVRRSRKSACERIRSRLGSN
jgi:DNA mismatch endonuclease (patch repair protein)